MGQREAYLKPDYASWYPGLPAGQWIGANTAQRLVRLQLQHGEPKWESFGRVLDPEHFLFRGGEPAGGRAGERRASPLGKAAPGRGSEPSR
jgi:hypothetical protein